MNDSMQRKQIWRQHLCVLHPLHPLSTSPLLRHIKRWQPAERRRGIPHDARECDPCANHDKLIAPCGDIIITVLRETWIFWVIQQKCTIWNITVVMCMNMSAMMCISNLSWNFYPKLKFDDFPCLHLHTLTAVPWLNLSGVCMVNLMHKTGIKWCDATLCG